MCTLVVMQTVACLVSEGELTWTFMSTLLATQTVICLVLGGELVQFLICTLLVTQMWPVLLQWVSWSDFLCALFW